MDAYVCVGTDVKNEARVWVMSRSADLKITFWESITGNRYSHPAQKHRYLTLDCLFNNESYYANIQKSNNVFDMQFDIENEAHFKSMSRMKLNLVKKLSSVPFCPSTIAVNVKAVELENSLRIAVDTIRKDLGVSSI